MTMKLILTSLAEVSNTVSPHIQAVTLPTMTLPTSASTGGEMAG